VRQISRCLWCSTPDLKTVAKRPDGVGVVKCNNCLLVMNSGIPDGLENSYEEGYFNAGDDKHLSGYEDVFYTVSPAFLLWQNCLIETARQSGKDRFLEIGVATGGLLEILKEYQPTLELSGIDISNFAINVSRKKGFAVKRATIEKYKAEVKQDIIFSSETMEHLDDLRSFLAGAKRHLSPSGLFLFYVPSISLADAEKQGDKYIRFTLNMEHILHFAPEFFEGQLSQFFGATVLIKEFKTSYGPSIIGAVAHEPKRLKDLGKLFDALERNVVPPAMDHVFYKNLAIVALKFGQTDLADRSLKKASDAELNVNDIELIKGLRAYHLGELEKASLHFESYLRTRPESLVAIKLTAAIDKSLKNYYLERLRASQQKAESLQSDIDSLKSEVARLRTPKIIRVVSKVKPKHGL
jgi:SAM-dependent methyltransferase